MVAPVLERRFVPKDQIIIKEGDFGTQAYLIQAGMVSVYITKEGQEVEISRLEAGQIVGEMAFINDGPRSANVKALTDTTLIVISRQQFQEKLRESDPTVRALVHMMTQRIVESNNALFDKKSDAADLKETARIIYGNIHAKLGQHQQRNFQNTVLPHLEALIQALDTFTERYSDSHD